jgi:hypothetical protein
MFIKEEEYNGLIQEYGPPMTKSIVKTGENLQITTLEGTLYNITLTKEGWVRQTLDKIYF